MDFGWALRELRDGARVARREWNELARSRTTASEATWLCLVPADQWGLGYGIPFDDGHCDAPRKAPWILTSTPDNRVAPWQPSHADLLATDWEHSIAAVPQRPPTT